MESLKTKRRFNSPDMSGMSRRSSRRPSWLSKQPSNEDLLEVLRTSLAASTPSPTGYRDGPPSSNASSADHTEPDDCLYLDDDDEPCNATEWEGWINWAHTDTLEPSLKRMAIRL